MLEKFIKDYDKPEKAHVRNACGKLAGAVGIGANILLFIIKITFGLITSSVSVIADSINNLSDAGSSILTLVGYSISDKPADKEHPYGHARMEYLCGLFISVIVTVLGFQMLTNSIGKLYEGEGVESYSLVSVIVIASTILVKIAIALFYTKLGRHINSATLKASAIDSISDVIATSAVVAGMLLTPVTGPMTDGILGIIIAVYILIMGIKLIKETSNTLLGVAPDIELVKKIISKIRSYKGVLGIHDLVIHSYGADRCFASVHVEMDADDDIMESHDTIDNIEADIAKEMNIHLVIHLDPVHTKDERINELHSLVTGIVSEIASEYGTPLSIHDFRVVLGITHSNLLFDISVSSDMVLSNTELCGLISERIKNVDEKYNAVITVDRDYFSHRYGIEKDD